MIQNRCASRGPDRWTLSVLFLLTCAGSTLPANAQAQDEDVRWTNDSELSFLLSGGNAGASTLGVRNSLRRIGASSEIRIDLAGLRTEATKVSRIAEGNGPADFVLREERNTERTAERYSVEARYDRSLSERFFAFGSYGWTRDTFAGFERRVIGSAGTGNQWGPGEEDWTLKIGYGVTYTRPKTSASASGASYRLCGVQTWGVLRFERPRTQVLRAQTGCFRSLYGSPGARFLTPGDTGAESARCAAGWAEAFGAVLSEAGSLDGTPDAEQSVDRGLPPDDP